MTQRSILAAVAACLILAPAASAAPVEPVGRIELAKMMGRWYEVARVPNVLQKGCQAGASEWAPATGGFAAKATVADPRTNAKFKMTFFGGVVSQDYVVVEHRAEQGWLVLATANGKYLWLMSQKPTLPAAVKSQALARIRQLGFDVGRLEFPLPARS